MTAKQEMAKLKEIGRVYRNPAERISAYKRQKWILLGVAWSVIFMSAALGKLEAVPNTVSLGIAVVGGCMVGLAVWFSAAASQIPLLVRYTALREEEIQKRLDELKDT